MVRDSQKSVVITGASSFVGCHLAKAFAGNGWVVAATGTQTFDAYEGIQAERLKWIKDAVSWQVLDLRNENAVRRFIADVRPHLWIHHAGFATNYGSLDYDLAAGRAVNVKPLAYIYEALAQARCGGAIVTGSSMEYSDTDKACDESDECKPSTPYGRSKLEETQTAERLSKQYSLPTRVARLFIPFGPLDAPNKVLPYVAEQLGKRQPAELSMCTQRRDFLSIVSVTQAYSSLVEDLKRTCFDIFNICSGKAETVRHALEVIADQLGASRDLLRFGKRPMRPGEPDVSYGSCDRARKMLGWEPHELESGVKELLRGVR